MGDKYLTNKYLYRQFSNSASEMFDYTMTNIMDGFYNSSMNSSTDGKFKAVCLSGIMTEDGSGEGTGTNDAKKNEAYINIIVRPLTDFGSIIPDPRNSDNPNEINDIISLHGSTFLARSDDSFDLTNAIEFGQIIDCYFEKGSISNSNFQTLRFSQPAGRLMDMSFFKLGLISGVETARSLDWANAGLLGTQPVDMIEDNIIKKWANDLPHSGQKIGGIGISKPVIQAQTEGQLQFWKGKKEKGSGPEFAILTAYWNIINMSNWTYNGTPWSAAFISWILMTSQTGFPGAASHMQYTDNIMKGKGAGWEAFSLTKGAPLINVGDVLVKTRGSGTPKDDGYWYSHGDVVYKIENNVAFLAGGNIGDTAKIAAKIKLDSDGRAPDIKLYLIILKKVS